MQKPKNSSSGQNQWYNFLAKIPPIRWVLYWLSRIGFVQLLKEDKQDTSQPLNETINPNIGTKDESYYLRKIVESVVNDLDYVAAFLATYEQGDVLPIRAFYIHPDILSEKRLKTIEAQISKLANRPITISDPKIARVYRYRDEDKANLSIQAVEAGRPIRNDELFSLFTPIIPEIARPILKGIQDELGVKQVVAVPFTVEYEQEHDGRASILRREDGTLREIIGNLFAVKKSEITEQDINVLKAFGYQAAAALQHSYLEGRRNITHQFVSNVQRNLQNRKQTFEEIVKTIVDDLQYVASAIFLLDGLGNLRLDSYYLDKTIASEDALKEWYLEISKLGEAYTQETDLRIGELNIYKLSNAKNLAYEAIQKKSFATNSALYSVVYPMVASADRERVKEIQEVLGISSVLAIPLFSLSPDQTSSEYGNVIGAMLVASRSRGFTPREIDILKSLGEQVANTQIFTLSEQRRRTALSFARRAVNMNASIHKLNNHIAAVNTALSILCDEAEANEGETNTFLLTAKERIGSAVDLLDSLDQAFLDFSEDNINLHACVKRAMEKLKMELDGCKIETSITKSDNLPLIYAFRELLIEIFRVFIKRAILAIMTLGGEGKISIHIEHMVIENLLRVSINDNGLTISQDELPHVFEIDDSKADAEIGFGLFWGNDYISEMGGKITVESLRNTGTTFNLYIPIRTHEPA